MKLFPTPKSETVAEWLELATNKLAPAARARIGVEIEAHFADAMEAHLHVGMSEVDARTAALAELGDAWAAARRFREEHLTAWEAREIEVMAPRSGSVKRLVLGYVVFALILLGFVLHKEMHNPRFFGALTLVCIACVAIPTHLYSCVRVNDAKCKTARFFFWYSVSILNSIGFSLNCFVLSLVLPGQQHEFYKVYVLLMIACLGLPRFQLWRKLQRSGFFRDETPPRDVVIS